MTENKRFDAVEYGSVIVYRENKKNMWSNEVHVRLNELYDENQEVFDSIDNRLRYYQEFLENEKRNGRDIMLLQRIVDDLKDLKRIKKGDDCE